ncbi:MAG: flagellar basal body rod protein FlgB, partial [bacterium]
EVKKMSFLKDMLGDHYEYMRKALESAWQRQQVIASNVANATNPNYVSKDLNFEQIFAEIRKEKFDKNSDPFNVKLQAEDPEHISGSVELASYTPEASSTGKKVDINEEINKSLENQIKYQLLLKGSTSPLKSLTEIFERM